MLRQRVVILIERKHSTVPWTFELPSTCSGRREAPRSGAEGFRANRRRFSWRRAGSFGSGGSRPLIASRCLPAPALRARECNSPLDCCMLRMTTRPGMSMMVQQRHGPNMAKISRYVILFSSTNPLMAWKNFATRQNASTYSRAADFCSVINHIPRNLCQKVVPWLAGYGHRIRIGFAILANRRPSLPARGEGASVGYCAHGKAMQSQEKPRLSEGNRRRPDAPFL